jgi:phage shock protein PspC (stress-responsive transcriptional regulator)
MLDKANKKIAGVCAGFARYFDADVTLVRVLWLAIALGTGVGFIAYLVAWIIMPSDHGLSERATTSAHPGERGGTGGSFAGPITDSYV